MSETFQNTAVNCSDHLPDPCDLQNIGPDTNLLHLTLEQRMASLPTAASILDPCRHCLLSCTTAAWASTAERRLPWPCVVTAQPATWTRSCDSLYDSLVTAYLALPPGLPGQTGGPGVVAPLDGAQVCPRLQLEDGEVAHLGRGGEARVEGRVDDHVLNLQMSLLQSSHRGCQLTW